MTEIVTNKVVASQLPERRPTALATTHANFLKNSDIFEIESILVVEDPLWHTF